MNELTQKAKVLAELARQRKLKETLDKLARQNLAGRFDVAPGK